MLQNAHPAYAELHCLSAFSFQRGASTARELFERAQQLGYRALAITDEASLAGIVRALEASRQTGVRLIVGSEMQVDGGPKLVLLAQTLQGYSRLCHLITLTRRRAPKGEYRALREDFERASNDGLLALWLPSADVDDAEGAWVRGLFPGRAWLAVELHRGPDDAARLQQLRETGARLDLLLVASGDVHMHARNRRALQDVLTAIRCRCPSPRWGCACTRTASGTCARGACSHGILCQGRGSAANSAVCYALGITEIDPARMRMLFERFVSKERNEPPDIDIDFEHERREEVLQYVFERYGRGRGAMRDVAKAMGLPPDLVDQLARCMDQWGGTDSLDALLRGRGFDPDSPILRKVVALTTQLVGFPRHLSQHPGGFVISEHPLATLVPVENAAMEGRR